MIVRIQRQDAHGHGMHGVIDVDGHPLGVTLERLDTLIPAGKYRVRLYYSTRNKRMVPLLQNVPGHTYIEIHPGNAVSDSTGCVLVGLNRAGDLIEHSVVTLEALLKVMRPALTANPDDVWVQVIDPPKDTTLVA